MNHSFSSTQNLLMTATNIHILTFLQRTTLKGERGCNAVSLLLSGTDLEKVAHSQYVKSGSLSFVLLDPAITHGHESFALPKTSVTP